MGASLRETGTGLGFDSIDFGVLTVFESGGRDQTSSFSREIWKRCYSLGRGGLRTAGNSDMAQSCKCCTSLWTSAVLQGVAAKCFLAPHFTPANWNADGLTPWAALPALLLSCVPVSSRLDGGPGPPQDLVSPGYKRRAESGLASSAPTGSAHRPALHLVNISSWILRGLKFIPIQN